MITYKLFRIKNGKLYPLYVEANRETPIGKWLTSSCGDKADETHVKSKLGSLSLRSGWHSTNIPFTNWIGKKQKDGTLAQKPDTVWCECEVEGKQVESKTKNGYRIVPKGAWYYFRTNSKQTDPWIISDKLKVNKILSHEEVTSICKANGIKPQPLAI